jgi:DnaJ-domain-containing protein 1
LINPDIERAYRVLGIDAGASRARLEAAYLQLVERYNPAKVEDLGTEFTSLAVRKLAEVTAAFETVREALGD